MKKILISILIFSFLTLYLNAENRKLIIVAEDWPPFEFINNNNKVVGIDVDIVDAIFKKMDIKYEVKILPWARAWSMVEKGQADASFSTSRKEKREPYLYYPKEDMWTSEYVFFVRKDKKQPHFRGYEDAKNSKIGIIRGNSYHPDFWAANLDTEEVTNLEQNFKKLAGGRVDLIPMDKTIGLYTSTLLKIQNKISYYDFIIFSKGYPMPFAKNSTYPDIKKVADEFEKQLIELKTNGEYDKIRDKWLK